MGPGKKNKKRQTPANAPRAPKTIDCTRCGEVIYVPNKCMHGRKLVNCRDTTCIIDHVTNHEQVCPVTIKERKERGEAAKDDAAARREQCYQRAHERQRAVLVVLIEQELANIEKMRGMDLRYLNGVSKTEFLAGLQVIDIDQVRKIADVLKSVSEGTAGEEAQIEEVDEGGDSDDEGVLTPTSDD